ncbi:MAG TPA: enoyl-CoA hydratase/isomerase family protein [Xanthobacteraceae bacterium]|nr:enoyl-CoA hydratase/isomerase family protein [Xanthobacteraceae bacterium]
MTNLICTVADGVAVATLNRPGALNAIDLDLIDALHRQLRLWERDRSVRAVVVRGAGTRAFCAGGDVRAVYEHRGDDAFMDAVYRREYVLDDAIHRYPKPYVALMSGIVMGGGCGISVHGKHRVVTESTVLAMPECRIGLFPDVAGSHFLARCPDHAGMYMGLTGLRIGGGDAVRLGLADHYVPSARLDELIAGLRATADVESAVAPLRAALPASALPPAADMRAVFGRPSVAEIMQALKRETAGWAADALTAMETACPFSLELTFRAIREGAGKTMRDCLVTDFRIAQRIMKMGDYFEGVRALIIDKDNAPRWNPAHLRDVRQGDVDACFAPLANELTFPDD